MKQLLQADSLSAISSRRLTRFNRLLALGCLAAMIGLPLFVLWQWSSEDATTLYLSVMPKQGGRGVISGGLDLWQRLLGGAMTMVPIGCTVAGLHFARRCFQLFGRGEYFDIRAVKALRGFAGMTALSCVLGFVLQAPLSVVLSFHNPVGQRFISLGIGTDQLYALFISATVWVIAAVMARAVAIARENAEFV